MRITTHSLTETETYGKTFAKQLQPRDVVLLYGDLGAGKTSFVKGIAKGLGITQEITSPTFTLMNVYPVKNNKATSSHIGTLIHIDTYRLKDEPDLIEIGVTDYLQSSDTACLIEWPEKIESILKKNMHGRTISVHIAHGINENEREILVS